MELLQKSLIMEMQTLTIYDEDNNEKLHILAMVEMWCLVFLSLLSQLQFLSGCNLNIQWGKARMERKPARLFSEVAFGEVFEETLDPDDNIHSKINKYFFAKKKKLHNSRPDFFKLETPI